ncbi:MAG: response regulator transcription factor [Candidatus Dormibacteraceae bacterium]
MAHWTIRVSGTDGAAELERAFSCCARLEIELSSARWHRSHLHLELGHNAATLPLIDALKASGFDIEVAPGDHKLEVLSDREQEILGHLSSGLQLKEAARQMGIETSTAREYWERAKRKLAVKTVGQAASLWTSARR